MELLSKYVEFKNGKKRPNNKGSIPVYGGNGILDYTDVSNMKSGVVIGRVGAYCGSVFLVNDECWVSDNAIKATCRDNMDLKYLYYLLSSLHLNERRIGTSQPLLTQSILNNIEVNIPVLHVQKKISSILETLDRKIKINKEINNNLEQQAKALYKDWFFEFSPFSSNGNLPDGWRFGLVGDIIQLHDSKRVPLSGAERDKMAKVYPYYGATSLMDYVDNYLFDGIYLLLGEDGSVIDKKGFPILQYVEGKFWVNNHAHIITGKNGFSVEQLYLLFSLTNVQSIVTGAVQPKISQTNLKKLPVIIPSEKDLKKFDVIVQPIFAQIRNLRAENNKLSVIRDSLLPKLMSDEIDVSNINL